MACSHALPETAGLLVHAQRALALATAGGDPAVEDRLQHLNLQVMLLLFSMQLLTSLPRSCC